MTVCVRQDDVEGNYEDLLLSSSVVSLLGVKRQRLILLSASQDKKWCGFFCICEDLYEVFLNYIYCFGQDFHKLRS